MALCPKAPCGSRPSSGSWRPSLLQARICIPVATTKLRYYLHCLATQLCKWQFFPALTLDDLQHPLQVWHLQRFIRHHLYMCTVVKLHCREPKERKHHLPRDRSYRLRRKIPDRSSKVACPAPGHPVCRGGFLCGNPRTPSLEHGCLGCQGCFSQDRLCMWRLVQVPSPLSLQLLRSTE